MVVYKPIITIKGIDVTSRYIDPRIARVLNVANDLADGYSGNVGFLHSVMCKTCLPCGQPPVDTRKWESTNGYATMLIEAGNAFDPKTNVWRELPLPYGAKARLALIYLSTAAVRGRSPIIKLDGSMTGFLKMVIRRAPNSQDIEQFKLQMSALSVATVRLVNDNRQSNSNLVSGFDLMWHKSESGRVLWPSEFELSAEYWEGLKDKAVPLDLEAIAAISHSALAIDIYLWLAQRLLRIKEPYTVYWAVLWKQFGSGYARLRDFRRKFLQALRYATAVYPMAVIEEAISEAGTSKGIKLHKSPPPVPLRR